eukprot:CAMPEP_0194367994 /NCGR_PEP_ID=MMETSP0174-20130528/16182_1 /TAXON_ID=216777 /ORGANISM="Proboscia alata, Strain PI-D3" /LENGTH=102 /DNA_ID=CAMNT_0039144109 /DNA_START=41 /DNA_END=349 /DNA_ORIENTATION=-
MRESLQNTVVAMKMCHNGTNNIIWGCRFQRKRLAQKKEVRGTQQCGLVSKFATGETVSYLDPFHFGNPMPRPLKYVVALKLFNNGGGTFGKGVNMHENRGWQ